MLPAEPKGSLLLPGRPAVDVDPGWPLPLVVLPCCPGLGLPGCPPLWPLSGMPAVDVLDGGEPLLPDVGDGRPPLGLGRPAEEDGLPDDEDGEPGMPAD